MSSHREAPEISKDPAADNTDVYAFVDQTDPTKVNLIANFNPFEIPYGGPNFSEFADDVLYTINVSNAGASLADISYQFRFTTTIKNPNTFLYNTGQVTSYSDAAFNRPQTYTVTKVVRAANGSTTSTVVGSKLTVPPCNVGERSTPNYEANLGSKGVQALTTTGGKVFAGPRSDAFYVDLGSVFDLGGLRPLNAAHLIPLATAAGVDGLLGLNVHTIALQVPIAELSFTGKAPTDLNSAQSVIGVWASTYRSRGRMFDSTSGTYKPFGDQVQISRLGNPLVNEVINPMAMKDKWNSKPPSGDSAFAQYVDKPELAGLLPVLYPAKGSTPSPFKNLAAYTKPRADLDAILLTGIPAGVLTKAYGAKSFATYTGAVKADLLRLNLAVPPTAKGSENALGVVVGDAAGFPNGRRVIDDVTSIELLAIAGFTIPLVDSSYTPDDIVTNAQVMDGSRSPANQAKNIPLLTVFPYLAPPASGYATLPPTPAVSGNPTANPDARPKPTK